MFNTKNMNPGGRRNWLKMMSEENRYPLFETPDALRTDDNEVFDIIQRYAHVTNDQHSPPTEENESHTLIILDEGQALHECHEHSVTNTTVREARDKVLLDIHGLTLYDECYVFNGKSWFEVVIPVKEKLDFTPMYRPPDHFNGGDRIITTGKLSPTSRMEIHRMLRPAVMADSIERNITFQSGGKLAVSLGQPLSQLCLTSNIAELLISLMVINNISKTTR